MIGRVTLKMITTAALLSFSSAQSDAADELLDPTFGSDGIASVSVGAQGSWGGKIAVQSDGKIVQVGHSRDGNFGTPELVTLTRFNADGTLDTDFGDQGVARINFGQDSLDTGFAVALQADGKILAGGAARMGTITNIGLVRFDSNGVLDVSFGDDGKVLIDLGGLEYITDLGLQSDGKIIGAGRFGNQFLVIRLNIDGELDDSFGDSGIVVEGFTENFRQEAFGVAVLGDDSIIVAGGGIRSGFGPGSGSTISLLKLTADGALDATFNATGKLALTIDGRSWARSVAVDDLGRFVVAGFGGAEWNSEVAFLVARFNSNGSLDTTFGDEGRVITEFPAPYDREASIWSVALQGDGRIVAAGEAVQNVPNGLQGLLLVRYHQDGSLDTSLDGADGRVAIGLDSSQVIVRSVRTQPVNGEERLLVGGNIAGVPAGSSFAVFRFRKPPFIFSDRFEEVPSR